jgi:hypothetical protein
MIFSQTLSARIVAELLVRGAQPFQGDAHLLLQARA